VRDIRKGVKSLKLAFVIPAFLPARGFGGPLNHVHAIAKIFKQEGHSVDIYTSNIANPSDLSETLPKKEWIDGILIKRYPAPLKLAGYWVTPSMFVDLKADGYDILHAHLGRSFQCDLAALVSKLKHNPFLITPHGSIGSHLDVDRGLKIHTLHIAHDIIAKHVLNAADKVIALNSFEKRHLLRLGVDSKKIVIIPNGISLSEFKQAYYDFKAGYAIEGKFVLFVGRLDLVKGLDTLIQAFSMVKRLNFKNVKLVLVGEDWGFKKKLLELARQYNILTDVLFIDHPTRADIISALHASEMVVLPSYYETFSITMLEAFACAKPVITSAVGGMPEIVANGENGLLVRPKDPKNLAEAITYLLSNEDKANKMGSAGEKLVTQRFLIKTVASQLENIYIKLCESRIRY
jgi:glycosyltransferase involved in cell wall biosynthesis